MSVAEVLFVTLGPVALLALWAWLYYVVTRDRGQVDKDRTMIATDAATGAAVLYVAPATLAAFRNDNVQSSTSRSEPATLGVKVVSTPLLASRTRW